MGAMRGNTPESVPQKSRLLDRDDREIQPGLLYRHFGEPTVWRCTEKRDGLAEMKLVWGLGEYGGEKVGKVIGLTPVFSRSYMRCDPAWLGREFLELKNFLIGEFSYEEAPCGGEVREL